MHVALDTTPLLGERTGVGHAVAGLLPPEGPLAAAGESRDDRFNHQAGYVVHIPRGVAVHAFRRAMHGWTAAGTLCWVTGMLMSRHVAVGPSGLLSQVRKTHSRSRLLPGLVPSVRSKASRKPLSDS